MKKQSKKYSRPRKPFDKVRIEEENILKEKYGLKDDTRVNVRPAEPISEREKWFENPQLVIGKLYTIKYTEKSTSGVPNASGVGFRDYE